MAVSICAQVAVGWAWRQASSARAGQRLPATERSRGNGRGMPAPLRLSATSPILTARAKLSTRTPCRSNCSEWREKCAKIALLGGSDDRESEATRLRRVGGAGGRAAGAGARAQSGGAPAAGGERPAAGRGAGGGGWRGRGGGGVRTAGAGRPALGESQRSAGEVRRPRKPRAPVPGRRRRAPQIGAWCTLPVSAPIAPGSCGRGRVVGRRQVIELPMAPVEVVEHVVRERRCPGCGARCRG